MTILILMVGLPGCGKSTLANLLRGKLKNSTIVCPDDIRVAIHGSLFDASREKEVWQHVDITQRSASIRSDYVIVDATNLNKARRLERFNVYPKYEKVVSIYVRKSTKVCIERRPGIPVDVISRMESISEMPLPQEIVGTKFQSYIYDPDGNSRQYPFSILDREYTLSLKELKNIMGVPNVKD